jgi:hypothetical protein
LAIVLLALRQRLTKDYGSGPATVMLIDRAVVAYQGFSMVSGWIGNLAIMIENELSPHCPSLPDVRTTSVPRSSV